MSANTNSTSTSFVGRVVAKLTPDSGAVVKGVVMELTNAVPPSWRAVFRDDTMQLLSEEQLHTAMLLATEREAVSGQDPGDGTGEIAQDALIMHGKRKRNAVNYRALNDLLFAGKADSDAEDEEDAEDYQDEGADDGEEEEEEHAGAEKVAPPSEPSKRTRRQRNVVDYRAMHEGAL